MTTFSRRIGTPGEYTDDLYRVYFELGEHDAHAGPLIAAFLVERSRDHPAFAFTVDTMRRQAHGYDIDLPLQLVPEVVAALAAANVAVYQVVRIGKL